MTVAARRLPARIGPVFLVGAVWLSATGALGCTVTPPERAVWVCATDDECVPPHVCRARAGDPVRTCVHPCGGDEDCGPGARCLVDGTCARTCSFDSAGRPIGRCPDGMFCARLEDPRGSDRGGEGICGMLPTCARDSDCQVPSRGTVTSARCPSSLAVELAGLPNLTCLPAPDRPGGPCPAGTVATAIGCLPSCDSAGETVACPPGMACFAGVLAHVDAEPSDAACFYGLYGAPCRDQVECFVGSCLEVAPRKRQCTMSCEEAARLSGVARTSACDLLRRNAGPLARRHLFECSSGSPNALCVARGGIGAGCADPSDCLDGLTCLDGLCTRECFDDADCKLTEREDASDLARGYCDGEGRCQGRLEGGSPCEFDAQCVTDLCASPATPGARRTCAPPRPIGSFCVRDEECISRRCAIVTFFGVCTSSRSGAS